MKNITIRNYANKKNVRLWQIADAEGITDFTFSRRLRHEFSKEETARLKGVIDQIAKRNK